MDATTVKMLFLNMWCGIWNKILEDMDGQMIDETPERLIREMDDKTKERIMKGVRESLRLPTCDASSKATRKPDSDSEGQG